MTDLAETILRDVPRFNVTVGDHTDPSALLLETDVLAALSAHLDPALTERAGEVLEGVTPAPDAILAAPVTHLGVNTDGVIDDDVYALMVETEAGGSIIQGLREAMEYTKGMLVEPPAPDAAEAQIAALRAERDEAIEAKLDAISTLDAWFDRRKLGHKAVDQAVVDAASGYLRTSRVGGMPQEESDLIIGVIQDMARLGLFADLFARAALTTENSHD